MNREVGISALRELISSGKETQTSIALRLGIDASQVSKIASGKFRKMSGNALNICKFSYLTQINELVKHQEPDLVNRLNELTASNPIAAHALVGILEKLIGEKA